MIKEPVSEGEWLVKIEELCLADDIAWLDEAMKDNEEDRDFLDITALSNELLTL